MFLLSHLFRFLGDSWRSPSRARLVYLAMTLAFAGLTVVAAALGDAAVAAVAAAVAIATFALAVFAPRLTRIASPPPDVR